MLNHAVLVCHYSFAGDFLLPVARASGHLTGLQRPTMATITSYTNHSIRVSYTRGSKRKPLICPIESRTGHLLPDLAYSAAN